ncbi:MULTISPECIES: hypothetical protein [Rhizobium]|uniref:Uncharacterized protein n=1 Tax=Rhizobium tropici TaxID=398 RepID=A0A6P1C3X4_RHITR|nr:MULTISPECIES: hypothetical protein [Rhizobium]MBB4240028.1 hypothetical protein [Rhizobium tropici]MBB5591298.1 hypothetical protein [Rhizobium tropici]MBB6490618.1 hypothetical protein [Rhizobium tropici]NEV10263.1 hypothetical protein [Rhizobium tropici]
MRILVVSVALAVFSLGWSIRGALRGSVNAMVIWLGFAMFWGMMAIMYSMARGRY